MRTRRRIEAIGGASSKARWARICFNTGTPECRLHYWRENGCEVDFILTRGRRLVAFEVKSGARRARVSGLKMFGERFNAEASVVVGEGGLALSEFLSIPAGEWFENR